ncbi:MAG: glycerol-3-phosphate 1-O-acyltransferase PlsY [Atopobiaceae bacterium]|jgi:glycerol-3-phosphate acyltransferase PlsY
MAALIGATGVMMLVAYLVGGIPFGLLATRKSAVDIRHKGSGNIGMTNVARTVGARAAALTFVGDMGKGLLIMLISRALIAALCFSGDWSMLSIHSPFALSATLIFAACILGHVFSPYLHFHGGKGISVGFGAGLGLFVPVGLGMLVVFLAFVIPTRYISLGSIMAAISLPIQCALWGMAPGALIPICVVACVVVWAHRSNVKKLISHQESKFMINKHDDGEQ